ncbi:MAG TPA: GumC family protein [Xanthobacteraceae bacterium]|nr:GumC family protein [Xanthobacteraceae bacterium]
MFQAPREYPAVAPADTAQQSARTKIAAIPGLDLDLTFIRRRWHWIILAVAAALLIDVAAELTLTPRYRAVSQILIGPVDLQGVDKSVVPTAQSADANVIEVESETRVLTSDRVLRRVVETEKLANDREFNSGGSSRLEALISLLKLSLGFRASAKPATDPEAAAVRGLQRDVTAKRTERTYVVDLAVETADPEKSARLANAIVAAYFAEQSAAHTEAARRVAESLTSRLAELRERVRRSEEAVEHYKSEQGIVGASGRLVDEQQLTELNNQLTAAQARTAEAKAKYDEVRKLQERGADPGGTLEAVQSTTIGLLRQQYAAAVQRQANLSAELGPQHPYVAEARAQVRNAQRVVGEEVARVVDATRTEYERARANQEQLSGNLEALKQRAISTGLAFVKLRELEREVDASRAVYEAFLVRARETSEQERVDTVNVRVLSDAEPPLDRSWPPRRLVLLIAALVCGLLGGIGFAYAAEQIERVARPLEPATPSMARAA